MIEKNVNRSSNFETSFKQIHTDHSSLKTFSLED